MTPIIALLCDFDAVGSTTGCHGPEGASSSGHVAEAKVARDGEEVAGDVGEAVGGGAGGEVGHGEVDGVVRAVGGWVIVEVLKSEPVVRVPRARRAFYNERIARRVIYVECVTCGSKA